MDKVFTVQNETIQISVKEAGAELCGIKLLAGNKDYMWNANPEIWAGYAPVLFPIIGALKEGSYFFKGKKYSLPRHGFIRNNSAIQLIASSKSSLTFQLKSSPETLKIYPFHFEFLVSYSIVENRIIVNHEVKNLGDGAMFFSVGAHPAFKCPIDPGENYNDYFLEFEHNETAYTYQIETNGLMGEETDLILNDSNTINLHHQLFDKGALVFKNLHSKQIRLISKKSGNRIQVDYEGFPYLGIWAKPNANYVCVEPWIGIADSVDTNQDFETKEGIIRLPEKDSFEAGYSISIF